MKKYTASSPAAHGAGTNPTAKPRRQWPLTELAHQGNLIPDPLADFLRDLPRIEAIIPVLDYFDDEPPEILGAACDLSTREVRYVSEIPEFFIDRNIQEIYMDVLA